MTVLRCSRPIPLASFFAQPENLRLFRRLAQSSDAVQYSVPELELCMVGSTRWSRVLNQVVPTAVADG